MIIAAVVVVLVYMAYRRESFDPSPSSEWPWKVHPERLDSTPGPDLKAISDDVLTATPTVPMPLPELSNW